jgi:hypothetical protein
MPENARFWWAVMRPNGHIDALKPAIAKKLTRLLASAEFQQVPVELAPDWHPSVSATPTVGGQHELDGESCSSSPSLL